MKTKLLATRRPGCREGVKGHEILHPLLIAWRKKQDEAGKISETLELPAPPEGMYWKLTTKPEGEE